MALLTCGTVVDQKDERVIVRIKQERCANCTGCVRFNFPKTVSAIGSQSIGECVAVRTSAVQLSLASLIAFGIPVITLFFVSYISQTVWILLLALSMSVTTVYLAMRFGRLQRFLKIYADTM